MSHPETLQASDSTIVERARMVLILMRKADYLREIGSYEAMTIEIRARQQMQALIDDLAYEEIDLAKFPNSRLGRAE